MARAVAAEHGTCGYECSTASIELICGTAASLAP